MDCSRSTLHYRCASSDGAAGRPESILSLKTGDSGIAYYNGFGTPGRAPLNHVLAGPVEILLASTAKSGMLATGGAVTSSGGKRMESQQDRSLRMAGGAVRRFGHRFASVVACRSARRWLDFGVLCVLGLGVGLASAWTGVVILLFAVVNLVRPESPALPVSLGAGRDRDIDGQSDTSWDSPARRHASMTHEHVYRSFEENR